MIPDATGGSQIDMSKASCASKVRRAWSQNALSLAAMSCQAQQVCSLAFWLILHSQTSKELSIVLLSN